MAQSRSLFFHTTTTASAAPTTLLPELPAAVNGRGPYVTTKITAPHGILTALMYCVTSIPFLMYNRDYASRTPQLLQVHRNETALSFQGIPSSQPGPEQCNHCWENRAKPEPSNSASRSSLTGSSTGTSHMAPQGTRPPKGATNTNVTPPKKPVRNLEGIRKETSRRHRGCLGEHHPWPPIPTNANHMRLGHVCARGTTGRKLVSCYSTINKTQLRSWWFLP